MKPTLTLLTVLLALCSVNVPAALNAAEPPHHTSMPDVRPWRTATYDEAFFQGRTVCGEEALKFMWQGINWRSNPDGIPEKFSKLQRLLSGEAVMEFNGKTKASRR